MNGKAVKDMPRKDQSSSTTFEPKDKEELARFLEDNKGVFHEIWVVITKKSCADPQPVSFNEAVGEAVKLGLIDSRTKTVSKEKYAIRFTKRKTK